MPAARAYSTAHLMKDASKQDSPVPDAVHVLVAGLDARFLLGRRRLLALPGGSERDGGAWAGVPHERRGCHGCREGEGEDGCDLRAVHVGVGEEKVVFLKVVAGCEEASQNADDRLNGL